MGWAIFSEPKAPVRSRFAVSVSSAHDPAYANFNLPLDDENGDGARESAPCDIDALTPPNETLLRLAKNNPPKQEWFDGEEECPFK